MAGQKPYQLFRASLASVGANYSLLEWVSAEFDADALQAWSSTLADCETIASIEYKGSTNGEIPLIKLSALLNALEWSTSVHTLILTDSAVTSAGLLLLANALQTNRKLETIELSRNGLATDAAVILAQALKNHLTIKRIVLKDNNIGDAGLASLCWILKINSAIQQIDVSGNRYVSTEVGALLAEAAADGSRLSYTPTTATTQSWRKYLRGLMNGEESDKRTAQALLNSFLCDPDPAINHTYGAVIAAWLGDTDTALKCLQLWPQQVAEVLRQCSERKSPFHRHGVLSEPALRFQAAQTAGIFPHSAAVAAVHKVARLLQVRSQLTLAHLHICGEESLTLQDALLTALPCRLLPIFKTHHDGTGQAVQTKTLGWVGMDGPQQRLFVHGHRSGEEHRAVQAAYLATPHSVHVLTVSLWDAVKKCEVDLAVAVERYRTCLRQVYSAVKTSTCMANFDTCMAKSSATAIH